MAGSRIKKMFILKKMKKKDAIIIIKVICNKKNEV